MLLGNLPLSKCDHLLVYQEGKIIFRSQKHYQIAISSCKNITINSESIRKSKWEPFRSILDGGDIKMRELCAMYGNYLNDQFKI